MSRKRRSYESGHSPKFLVVIDDTPECDRAVYFASRRALRIGAAVIMLRVIETHPQESFYRAVTQEGAIILYCPGENTGVWFLPGSGMGPLPEEAKRQMKEAIAAPVSGRKQVRR